MFLIVVQWEEVVEISRQLVLGDYFLYSHGLSD